MKYRTLGQTGIRISELFLGAMTFGEQGGVGAPLAECRSMLDAYLDAGGNVIDTAINYRGGLSEEIVGEILGERRDRFVLASEYTVTRDPTDPLVPREARQVGRAQRAWRERGDSTARSRDQAAGRPR